MATFTKIFSEGNPRPRPVDEIPPLRRLLPLGVQHVLAMYAGAVAVPLIVGGAMVGAGQLEQSDIVHLIMADLFVAGIAIFSGSLYLLSLTGARWLRAITPLGGLVLIAGWLCLVAAAWKH